MMKILPLALLSVGEVVELVVGGGVPSKAGCQIGWLLSDFCDEPRIPIRTWNIKYETHGQNCRLLAFRVQVNWSQFVHHFHSIREFWSSQRFVSYNRFKWVPYFCSKPELLADYFVDVGDFFRFFRVFHEPLLFEMAGTVFAERWRPCITKEKYLQGFWKCAILLNFKDLDTPFITF